VQITSGESGAVPFHGPGREGTVMAPFESFWPCLRACSACCGDYEDPERSVSNDAADEEADEEQSAGNVLTPVAREGFPVRGNESREGGEEWGESD
jgi:hypothetical protein